MRWSSLCVLLAACSDAGGGTMFIDAPTPDAVVETPDAAPPDAPANYHAYPACPNCQHAQYVIASLSVPVTNADAASRACDIDGDGEGDNQMGKAFAALKTSFLGYDMQMWTDTGFDDGYTIIVLYDVEYDPDLSMTQVAGLRQFVGVHDFSDGLMANAIYQGQGKFTIASEGGMGMGGALRAGTGAFGPGDGVVQLRMFGNANALTMPLKWSTVAGTFDSTTIQNGTLCGAIDIQSLRMTFIPQLANKLSDDVYTRSPDADMIKSMFDGDHSCDTEPACMLGSGGNCHCITPMEVESSSFIRALINPDLDLDPNQTNPFVGASDPTYANDAVSIAVGFSANHATFPLP